MKKQSMALAALTVILTGCATGGQPSTALVNSKTTSLSEARPAAPIGRLSARDNEGSRLTMRYSIGTNGFTSSLLVVDPDTGLDGPAADTLWLRSFAPPPSSQ